MHLDKRNIKEPIFILGFLKNKDFKTICDSLHFRVGGEFHLVPIPGTDRAESTSLIAQELSCLEISVVEWESAMDCLLSCLSLAQDSKRPIVIAGSVYLAGYLRDKLSQIDKRVVPLQSVKYW